VRAVILAAGDGGRLGSHTAFTPKPLVPVAGRPLVLFTLEALASNGVTEVALVTGHHAEQLERQLKLLALPGPRITFVHNPRFAEAASLSLRAARQFAGAEPFLLLMADHLLSSEIIAALVRGSEAHSESLIATDAAAWPPDYVDEATRVRLDSAGLVTAIGKHVSPFDALDTGAFLLQPSAWAAVDAAPENCELSVIFSGLAERAALRSVDVSGQRWYDVDTAADLEAAASLFAAGSRQ
jgi:choline kinase